MRPLCSDPVAFFLLLAGYLRASSKPRLSQSQLHSQLQSKLHSKLRGSELVFLRIWSHAAKTA